MKPESERMEKGIPSKWNQETTGVDVLVFDKIDSKPKLEIKKVPSY